MKNSIEKKELLKFASQINEREDRIQALKQSAVGSVNEALCESILQGQDLIAAHSMVRHGLWLDWLKTHCPKSQRMAYRYMTLAKALPKVGELTEAGSLRAALALCEHNEESESSERRRWPGYVEALSRFSKFNGLIERFPIEQWPAEGRAKLQQDLEPIARALWPERFR